MKGIKNIKRKIFQYRYFLFDIFTYNVFLFIFLNVLDLASNIRNLFFYYQILWYFISYLLGIYNQNLINDYSFVKKRLVKILLNLFISVNFSSLIILILFSSINLNDLLINIRFLSVLSFVSYLSQILFYFYIKKYFKISGKWLFVGRESTFKYISKTNRLLFYNYDIDYFPDLEDIKEINYKVYYGIIIDDDDLINKELNNQKINLKKIIIYNYQKWIEFYFYSIPGNFINKESLIYNLNLPDRISIELRIKRLSDILLSIIILILATPLIIFFSILIFLEDLNTPFYSQIRTGLDEKEFKIWKLRSMKIDSEDNGPQWSRKDDPRITKVGNFIRRTRIDELPQLISVISGNMSLIGPRPERPEIDKLLLSKIKNYTLRYQIKPGLSGWAQVKYPYGSSIEDSKIKLGYDLFYIYNYSIWLDFKILLETIRVILNAKNAIPKQ